MSCGAGKQNFRLLDSYVGWEDAGLYLEGFDDPTGIRLSLVDKDAVDPARVSACIPPRRLARGCVACEWFLVTPFPPESRLLHRDACHTEWSEKWDEHFAPVELQNAVSVATWRRYLAIADCGANKVYIFSQSGIRLVAQIVCAEPRALAFTPRGELLVSFDNASQIARYGIDGALRGFLPATITEKVDRMAVDKTQRLWLVTVAKDGAWLLSRGTLSDTQFQSATIDELQLAFPASGVAAEAKEGFSLAESNARGSTQCYSWYARDLDCAELTPAQPPRRQKQGQLLTKALDSGIPRCTWHRVRLDADVPSGTTLELSVATTEDDKLTPQGGLSKDPDWQAFPAGSPHPSDWTAAPANSRDFLIQQPPGRFLYLRLRFTTIDGTSTPVVRRIRLDFPRVTSIEHLPDIYRENPQAEEFTERFLSLCDSRIEDVDSVISRYPALLDPSGVPDQLLPWLGKFFDIGFDSNWNADTRRALLKNAPALYRERGTPKGLVDVLQLIFGVQPAISESSATGPWGAIGNRQAIAVVRCTTAPPPPSVRRTARLGAVRLFGKTKVRFRLGSSPLGGAPMRSYGNPDLDPFAEGSYRFRLLVPPMTDNSKESQQRFINLVEAQKPAHTVASVRFGGTGFLLGHWSAVGIDTGFIPLAAPILGAGGNVRLGRMAVLWSRSGAPATGTKIGERSLVGIQTIVG